MPGMPPSLASPLHPLQSIPQTPVPLRNSQAPRARMKGRISTKCRPATGWLRLQADSLPHALPASAVHRPPNSPSPGQLQLPAPCTPALPPACSACWCGPPALSSPSCLCEAGKVAESGKEVRRPGNVGSGWERKQTVQAANGILQSDIFVCGPNGCQSSGPNSG